MNMGKRGQITVFIILGIVIIAVILFLFLFFRKGPSELQAEQEELAIKDLEARNVYLFIKDCLKKTSEEALFHFGYDGGRTGFFTQFYDYGIYSVPYYYYEGISYIPEEDEISDGILGRYVDDNLMICIDNFNSFQGMRIEYNTPSTVAKIAPEKVMFNLNFPVDVYKGQDIIRLGPDFKAETNVRLGDILSICRTIIENQLTNELFIHWDYITEKTKQGFEITAYTENDNTIIYRIIDEKNQLFEENYLFQFANKYYIKPVES